MFVYLSILMGLLVIGTFSLVWERRWKGFRAAAKEAAQSAPSSMALRARVTEGLAVVRANLPFRQSTSVAIAPFRTWSTQALADDAALLQWLAALSEEAYAAFVE
ncbi:MAG: hypothetical protein KDE31_22015, partial [Caldilineaceae bacterium]|nr:hypothetical protein [Caldilineaceae bacterium]